MAGFISEVKFLGSGSADFVETMLNGGDDPADYQIVIYNNNGTIRSTNGLGAYQGTVAGKDGYLLSIPIHKNGAVALVKNGVVTSFISFNKVVTATEGPAASMTATQLGGVANSNTSLVSTDGVTYTSQSPPNGGTLPCFVAGTLIETPHGMRRVETLRVGDMVMTHSLGAMEIRWINGRQLHLDPLKNVDMLPIRFPRGALGHNMPARDVLVSPNHRICMQSPLNEVYFEDEQVLVAAKHLVGWNEIEIAREIVNPAYYHIVFDEHVLVNSSGLYSESFLPSTEVLQIFRQGAQDELFQIFPELKDGMEDYGQACQPCLRKYEAKIALKIYKAS